MNQNKIISNRLANIMEEYAKRINVTTFKPSKEFYKMVGIGQIRFWQIHRQQVEMNVGEMQRLANAFNVSPADFYDTVQFVKKDEQAKDESLPCAQTDHLTPLSAIPSLDTLIEKKVLMKQLNIQSPTTMDKRIKECNFVKVCFGKTVYITKVSVEAYFKQLASSNDVLMEKLQIRKEEIRNAAKNKKS